MTSSLTQASCAARNVYNHRMTTEWIGAVDESLGHAELQAGVGTWRAPSSCVNPEAAVVRQHKWFVELDPTAAWELLVKVGA